MNYTTRMFGKIVKRATCFVCGKQRECRIDRHGKYAVVRTVKGSAKLVPVCLAACSSFYGADEGSRR